MRSVRTVATAAVGLALLAVGTGMNSPAKPDDEPAYWRELSRLNTADKSRALEYARKGDTWYGATGGTAEARQAMIVTVLVDLGKMDEARREARAFMTAHPGSSYLPLVQGVTGIHPRPHGPRSNP